jgi:hypothetical protein
LRCQTTVTAHGFNGHIFLRRPQCHRHGLERSKCYNYCCWRYRRQGKSDAKLPVTIILRSQYIVCGGETQSLLSSERYNKREETIFHCSLSCKHPKRVVQKFNCNWNVADDQYSVQISSQQLQITQPWSFSPRIQPAASLFRASLGSAFNKVLILRSPSRIKRYS